MWSPTVCRAPITSPPPAPSPPLNHGRKLRKLAPHNGRIPQSRPLRDTTTKPGPSRSLIRHLSLSGKIDKALTLLLQAQSYDIPSCRHFLLACVTHRAIRQGELFHKHLLSAAPHLLGHPDVGPNLITLYAACGRLDSALQVFDSVASLDEVLVPPRDAWSSLSIAYSKNGLSHKSLLVFGEMVALGILPDNFSFSNALKSCARLTELNLGRAIHAMMVKLDVEAEPDEVLGNALMAFYLQCRCMDEAVQVFSRMPTRDVVAWNSLIAGLGRHGRLEDSLEVFRHMQCRRNGNIGFTWITLTTLLWSCAQLAALRSGKEVHAQMIKAENKTDVQVMNALMDMYGKCGEVGLVQRVFDLMSQTDLTSWNVLLNAYAICGSAEDVLKTFHGMVDAGVRPDWVTFIAVLSGCSRGGFVEEGRALFHRMDAEFGVSPTVEHYACLVDLLGRSGRCREAFEVVNSMPMEPRGSVWGSLLNSSLIHDDIQLGEMAAEKLFQLEPKNPGNYIILSNMYAKLKMWDKAQHLRDIMETNGIRKDVGCSWIHVGSEIRSFVAAGSVNLRDTPEYKAMWGALMQCMEARGYTPILDVVLHDVDEKTKYAWLCGHSERIALVAGLINSGNGMPIRIMKNLRVCVDCHNLMKMASDITRRLIVLRDTNRFHHFRDGVCSCKDFW